MPNQTFFNLPDEKREQILQVAIDEFADNDYDSASISRIVARAGIAKGSFYQYFADKEDLYGYLLGMLAEAKTQFLSLDHPDPEHIGIFAYLRWTIEVGVAFTLAYPKLTQIGLRALNAGRFPKPFDAQVRAATLAFYQQLVEAGKRQGDIAAEIDAELAAVIFDATLNAVGHYIVERVAREGDAVEQEKRSFLEHPEVKMLFAQTVGILEHGLGRRMSESTNERMKKG
jgi:TetR/AcrR family transcriptional regulator